MNKYAFSREVPDLADNQYLSLDGEVVEFEEIEWLEGDKSCSRFLIDDESVWLDEDYVEVEQ